MKKAARELKISLYIAAFTILLCSVNSNRAFAQTESVDSSMNSPAYTAALAAAAPVASADNDFGFDLLRQLNTSSKPDTNVFVSPVSITQALGMLYAGSAGETHTEIAGVLHVSKVKPADYYKGNAGLLTALKSPDSTTDLRIANAIWSQTGHPFGNQYREETADNFGAPSKTVDFTKPRTAAAEINNWVSTNTVGKITSMVLTNAVYFKGTWTQQFDPALTKPAPFNVTESNAVTLPTMVRTGTISSYFDQDVTVIRLPYSGTPSRSMIIILPSSFVSINDITKSLSANMFDQWISELSPRDVTLYLPKYHIDYSQDLTNSLQALGIKDAFSQAADLSPTGISDSSVTGVFHKATMDVDEKGTVAAAATGIVMRALVRQVPRTVRIDRPFICAIRDDNTKAILFLGIIRKPGQ
jgi:serpin B